MNGSGEVAELGSDKEVVHIYKLPCGAAVLPLVLG
jgi:hypothetical protein